MTYLVMRVIVGIIIAVVVLVVVDQQANYGRYTDRFMQMGSDIKRSFLGR